MKYLSICLHCLWFLSSELYAVLLSASVGLFLDILSFVSVVNGIDSISFFWFFNSSVQMLSHVWLFATRWTTAHNVSLSITNSWSPPKPMSIKSIMSSNHLILSVILFSSCPQSFPASGSFQMSQLFASCGQSIGGSASTSIPPMNTQDWSPLGWTRWLSLQSKGLSSVLQHHSSKASILWHSAFFTVQLSHPYMTAGKTMP